MLVAFALEQEHGEIAGHIAQCPACARYVKELSQVQEDIAGLSEQPIPRSVEKSILNWKRNVLPRTLAQFWGAFGEWYRNPVVIGLLLIALVTFLYTLFLFFI